MPETYRISNWPFFERHYLSKMPVWRNLSVDERHLFEERCQILAAKAKKSGKEIAELTIRKANGSIEVLRGHTEGIQATPYQEKSFTEFARIVFDPDGDTIHVNFTPKAFAPAHSFW